MSKLLRALLKHRAVRVAPDGTLTPAHDRVPKHTAAIFSDRQLLLADTEQTHVYGGDARCAVAEHAANPTAPRSAMKHADRPHLRFITAAMDTTNESATTEPARNGASVNRGTSAHE